jgi:hypothetical protein
MDIRGDIMLKRQNGAYARVGTERIVAWVIPQLDHGKSGEVTVAESSTLRLSSLGS